MTQRHEKRALDPDHSIGAESHQPETRKPASREAVNSFSSGVVVLDEAGTILYGNRAWREIAADHGLEPNFVEVGRDYLEVRRQGPNALNGETALVAEGIKQVLSGRQNEFQAEYLKHDSVNPRWLRIQAGRIELPHASRILVIQEDITENRESRAVRHWEAERLQQLLKIAHVLPWEADLATSTFTFVGDQAVEMLGYAMSDWSEPDFWRAHIHPEDRERVIADSTAKLNSLDNFELELRMMSKRGRVVWLHNLVTVIRDAGGRPKTVRGFSIDVTKTKQSESALRHLSGVLINAQEEERRRVARELHDDLNQRMALLSIELDRLAQSEQSPELALRLRNAQDQAKEISADIHRLSYRLHPSKLDHLGLAAAVRSLCQELSTKGELEVDLEQNGPLTHLSRDVTLCVFRIVQEALRNCTKHSGAGQARVVLENAGRVVRLTVSDRGCGFDPESDALTKGLGFTSMRERLRLLGGEIQINSRPWRGTTIEVSIPLEQGADAGLPQPQNDWPGSLPLSQVKRAAAATNR